MNIHELPKNERWKNIHGPMDPWVGCFWLALKNELERERFKDANTSTKMAMQAISDTGHGLKGPRPKGFPRKRGHLNGMGKNIQAGWALQAGNL